MRCKGTRKWNSVLVNYTLEMLITLIHHHSFIIWGENQGQCFLSKFCTEIAACDVMESIFFIFRRHWLLVTVASRNFLKLGIYQVSGTLRRQCTTCLPIRNYIGFCRCCQNLQCCCNCCGKFNVGSPPAISFCMLFHSKHFGGKCDFLGIAKKLD